MQSTLQPRSRVILIGGLNGIPRAMHTLAKSLTASGIGNTILDLSDDADGDSILTAVASVHRTCNPSRKHIIVGYSAGAMVPLLCDKSFRDCVSAAIFWDPSMSPASLFPKSLALGQYDAIWMKRIIGTLPITCFQSQHWAQHAVTECRVFDCLSSVCIRTAAHTYDGAEIERTILERTMFLIEQLRELS